MLKIYMLIIASVVLLVGCDDLDDKYNDAVNEQCSKNQKKIVLIPHAYECKFKGHDYIVFDNFDLSKNYGKSYFRYNLPSDCFVHSPECEKCFEKFKRELVVETAYIIDKIMSYKNTK